MRPISLVISAAALVSALVGATAACATNPATGKREFMLVSEQQEIEMGRQSDAEVRSTMGVYDDPKWQAYVTDVGMKLARQSHRPNLPWKFTVVDEQAVNAFALPGGFIYITRGILPFLRDEAELAAVLGHEVGHVDARHSASQVSKQQVAGLGLALGSVLAPKYSDAFGLAGSGLGVLFLKFGREDELEADALGTGYAAAAGWDPQAMPGLLDTLARIDEASGSSRGVPNWAMTHPPAADRVEKVQQAVAAAARPGATTRNRPQFEDHVNGVVVGDTREKGMVRGREFVHPVLRFAVTFPEGWEISNADAAVTASPQNGQDAAVVLQAAQGAGGNLRQAADAGMAKSGFQPAAGGRSDTVNGLPAYIGTYQGQIDQTSAGVQAGYIRLNGSAVYRILGIAPAPQFAGVRPLADATIASFRELSAQEANAIRDRHVTFIGVSSGDTWASLAAAGGNVVKASTLAIMNGQTPGSAPRPGARVRVVR